MKALIQLGCFLFLISLFFSCEPEYTYLAKEVEGEFFEAEIDGQFFRFTHHYPINSYSFLTLSTIDSFVIQDQLFIGAISEDGTQSMSIRGANLRLLDTDFPFSVSDTLGGMDDPTITFTLEREITQIFFNELRESGRVSLTVEEWDSDDYIEGTFEGTVIDENRNNKEVKNGHFRIKVVRQ